VPNWRSRLTRGTLPELVRALPPRQLLPLWIAIFATFSMVGLALDIISGGREPAPLLVLNVVASGLLALGYAVVSLPVRGSIVSDRTRPWGYAVMVAIHILYAVVIPRAFELLPTAPPGRLVIDGAGTIVAAATGYSGFLWFISVTGARYLRAQAEIALARDIHRVLVPQVEKRIGDFDFLGWSHASGDVGGDLVDLVEQDGAWLGYVADVSGHGVGSGVVMGMFKSALRMRARSGGSIASLLDDIHAVLMPLKQSQMFVTVACMRGGPDHRVECAVAGHLPILRVRNGCVEEVTSPQVAIGMFDDTRFKASSIECLPGDLFALLTDGLTEVFDSARNELGLEWAKRVLQSTNGQPLSTIADRLLSDARAHGAQIDDQTLLLIRRNQLAPGPGLHPLPDS
jgi:Stage II sporulation protein E (SpoIIE)